MKNSPAGFQFMVLKQYFRVWHVLLFTIRSSASAAGNTSESEWLFPVSCIIIDLDAYIVFSLNSEENSQGKTEAEMHALLRKHARRCQVPACVCSLVLRWKVFWTRNKLGSLMEQKSRTLEAFHCVRCLSYFDLCAFQIRLTYARSSVAVCLLLLSARNFTSCSTLSYTSVQLTAPQWPILPDVSF